MCVSGLCFSFENRCQISLYVCSKWSWSIVSGFIEFTIDNFSLSLRSTNTLTHKQHAIHLIKKVVFQYNRILLHRIPHLTTNSSNVQCIPHSVKSVRFPVNNRFNTFYSFLLFFSLFLIFSLHLTRSIQQLYANSSVLNIRFCPSVLFAVSFDLDLSVCYCFKTSGFSAFVLKHRACQQLYSSILVFTWVNGRIFVCVWSSCM